MNDLKYHKPETLDEALSLLKRYAGTLKPLAGGTDLMVQFRENADRLKNISHLMDISRLNELTGISQEGDVVTIGALCTHAQLACSPSLQKAAPLLCTAAGEVGSPQIRNRGTVGGNLMNGSPAADTLSPLVALEAEVELLSSCGVRHLPVQALYLGAGKLTVRPDELAVCFRFPSTSGSNTAFLKLGRRKALAISRLNAAIILRLEQDMIREARVVPGCVFPIPSRSEAAEAVLLGHHSSRPLFEACADCVSQEIIKRTGMRWSTRYKQPATYSLIYRALCLAAGIDPEEQEECVCS